MALVPRCSRSGGRPYALVWSPIPLISWLMPFIGHIGVCSSSGRTYDFAGPFTVNEDCLLFGLPTRYLSLATEPLAKGSTSAGSGSSGGAPPPPAPTGHRATMLTDGSGDPEAGLLVTGDERTKAVRPERKDDARDEASGQEPSAAAHSWDHRLGFAATTYRMLNYNIMTNNCHCFVAHFLNEISYRGGGWDMINLAALMFIRGRYTSLRGLLYTWLPWALLVAAGVFFGGTIFVICYAAVCASLLAWFLFYTWCCWRDLRF